MSAQVRSVYPLPLNKLEINDTGIQYTYGGDVGDWGERVGEGAVNCITYIF